MRGWRTGETDGWRYEDMPEDGQAWRDTLAYLDGDAEARYGTAFADATAASRRRIVQAVQDLGSATGTACPRLTCGACGPGTRAPRFYSHPAAWDEIGFPGPAYPRGYKNAGVGRA